MGHGRTPSRLLAALAALMVVLLVFGIWVADDAIDGVVKRLDDRFSNYFSPAEYKRFKESQHS